MHGASPSTSERQNSLASNLVINAYVYEQDLPPNILFDSKFDNLTVNLKIFNIKYLYQILCL